jgi:hypothetical protein
MPIILFSNELYRDLVKQNRNNIMLTELSEKLPANTVQEITKLIDRFLFILSKTGLLAVNSSTPSKNESIGRFGYGCAAI